jgi:hypothetical protein
MIKLYDGDSEREIGEITEAQLEILLEQLVEETLDEYTYNINPAVISSLEANGVEPVLIELLKTGLGGRTSMELRYEVD